MTTKLYTPQQMRKFKRWWSRLSEEERDRLRQLDFSGVMLQHDAEVLVKAKEVELAALKVTGPIHEQKKGLGK
jgi:hypothetical protein